MAHIVLYFSRISTTIFYHSPVAISGALWKPSRAERNEIFPSFDSFECQRVDTRYVIGSSKGHPQNITERLYSHFKTLQKQPHKGGKRLMTTSKRKKQGYCKICGQDGQCKNRCTFTRMGVGAKQNEGGKAGAHLHRLAFVPSKGKQLFHQIGTAKGKE